MKRASFTSACLETALAACRRGAAHVLALLLATGVATAQAKDSVDAFVARSFAQSPEVATLWLTPAIKEQARAAAGVVPEGARVRYWRAGGRTAWVLDRIGKEAPITFGVVVENGAIVSLQVITYRESRGHEIQAPRWLAQFAGARPGTQRGLDRGIDNITGATLSVRASGDVARLALFLHAQATGASTR